MNILDDNQEPAGSNTEPYSANSTEIVKAGPIKEIVREIKSCLVPCSSCTGIYIDTISGNRLRIICHHNCHYKLDKE